MAFCLCPLLRTRCFHTFLVSAVLFLAHLSPFDPMDTTGEMVTCHCAIWTNRLRHTVIGGAMLPASFNHMQTFDPQTFHYTSYGYNPSFASMYNTPVSTVMVQQQAPSYSYPDAAYSVKSESDTSPGDCYDSAKKSVAIATIDELRKQLTTGCYSSSECRDADIPAELSLPYPMAFCLCPLLRTRCFHTFLVSAVLFLAHLSPFDPMDTTGEMVTCHCAIWTNRLRHTVIGGAMLPASFNHMQTFDPQTFHYNTYAAYNPPLTTAYGSPISSTHQHVPTFYPDPSYSIKSDSDTSPEDKRKIQSCKPTYIKAFLGSPMKAYLAKRAKNNDAAKKSRLNRRQREKSTLQIVEKLRQENESLRAEVIEMRQIITDLRKQINSGCYTPQDPVLRETSNQLNDANQNSMSSYQGFQINFNIGNQI
uniref:BZIP domain-containing protein n=1 Tax=Heterorhabditis bacteriophora TaxID=37862 RepID=A0A1I7XCQ3_HETBA